MTTLGCECIDLCECNDRCTNCRQEAYKPKDGCPDPLFTWGLIEDVCATLQAHGYEASIHWPGNKFEALIDFLDELIHGGEPIEDATAREWAIALEVQGRRHADRMKVRHEPAPTPPRRDADACACHVEAAR